MLDMDDDDDEFGSGPYCQHWNDPSDCDEMCKCGHECHDHGLFSGTCEECGCLYFS